MKASDIVKPIPTVALDDPVLSAVYLMNDARLPGIVVVNEQHQPVSVIAGTQVLRMSILHAYHDDPALARVIDEKHADLLTEDCDMRTVGECLGEKLGKLVTAHNDATLLEVASLMSRNRCPLVAIVGKDKTLVGGITLANLLATLAHPPSPDELPNA